MTRLRTQGLRAAYPGFEVLHGIDLDLESGKLHAVLGPSGCGKSTLLRCVAGLMRPSVGRVLLDEQDVSLQPPHERGVVLLHQEDTLFPHLDVEGNVAFGLRLRRRPAAEIRERVARWLERVGLAGLGHRRPQELSGGQRQRVALARALVVEPRVLLLDEPLSHLDAPLRLSLRGELRRLLRAVGTTVVYVTHDREEAFAISDRLILLDHGSVVDSGPGPRIHERPANAAAARILGRRNLFAYQRVEGHAETAVGSFPLPADAPDTGSILLREEELRLHHDASGPAFRVESVEYVGGGWRITASRDGAWVRSEQADDGNLLAGEPAALDVSRARPLVFSERAPTPEIPGPTPF